MIDDIWFLATLLFKLAHTKCNDLLRNHRISGLPCGRLIAFCCLHRQMIPPLIVSFPGPTQLSVACSVVSYAEKCVWMRLPEKIAKWTITSLGLPCLVKPSFWLPADSLSFSNHQLQTTFTKLKPYVVVAMVMHMLSPKTSDVVLCTRYCSLTMVTKMVPANWTCVIMWSAPLLF